MQNVIILISIKIMNFFFSFFVFLNKIHLLHANIICHQLIACFKLGGELTSSLSPVLLLLIGAFADGEPHGQT